MKKSKWTLFWDMHSGGGLKESPYHLIFIEAPEEEAKSIFYNKFDHNPERVSCTCCGEDYSIEESESLEQLSAYHRECEFIENDKEEGGGHYIELQKPSNIKIREKCNTSKNDDWGLYQTLETFEERKDVLIIRKKDIKPKDRQGDIPQQGFIWVD